MLLNEIISGRDWNNLDRYGYSVTDSKEIGDYTIHLLQLPEPMSLPDGEEANVELAIQKHDMSFTTPRDQRKQEARHIKVDRSQLTPVKQGFIDVIKSWRQEYGPIAIGSYNKQKALLYKKLLDQAGIPVKDLIGGFQSEVTGFYI